MRHFMSLILLGLLLSACGGGGGGGGSAGSGSSPVTHTATVSGSNVAPIVVDAGPAGNAVNMPFVSVSLCVPGSTQCQTVDHILLDTGSSGLRILSSQLALPLAGMTDGSGDSRAECLPFVSGYTWGRLARADVSIGGQTASAIPIQLIDSTFATVPASCSSNGTDLGSSVSRLGARGILGIGMAQTDCGSSVLNVCATGTTRAQYYTCSGSCSIAATPVSQQVPNPVTRFASHNNGTLIVLPAIPAAGARNPTGSLILGIGTAANNAPGTATVYGVDSSGFVSTTFNGHVLGQSYVDSGSNGLFIDTAALALADCGNGFYCTGSGTVQNYSAVLSGSSGSPAITLPFGIADASLQFASGNTAFANVAGPAASGTFDWGLPFFFGRTVITAISGASTPLGTGPFVAF